MGGHRPPEQCPAPTAEAFHLNIVRTSYLLGYMTLAEFEVAVWDILHGGTSGNYRGGTPFTPPRMQRVLK